MAGLKGQDRLPRSDTRARRNAQALSGNADSIFGGALTVGGDGIVVLTLATISGLNQTSGLAITLEASNPSLQIASNALGIKFDGSGGLQKLAAGTGIKLDTNPGLVLGAGGIKVLLGSTPALTLTGGLGVLLDTSEPGLQRTTGLKILLASNPGLELSSGLKAKVASPIVLTASGIGLSGSDPITTTGKISGGTAQFGGSSHYSSFEADGTLLFTGDATVWDDLRVPMTATKTGGSKDPGFSVAFTNGAGSQGVFTYFFDDTTEEELFFAVQLPHGWKEGTSILPHIHWFPKIDGAANATVSWGMEYTWANVDGTIGNTGIIYTNTTTAGDATLVASKHYMSAFSAITASGKTISSMLLCRLFRDATGAGLTDDYTGDAGLLEIDFHYEADTIGSRAATTK